MKDTSDNQEGKDAVMDGVWLSRDKGDEIAVDRKHFSAHARMDVSLLCPRCDSGGRIDHPIAGTLKSLSSLPDEYLDLLTQDGKDAVRKKKHVQRIRCPDCEGTKRIAGSVSFEQIFGTYFGGK